MKIQALSVLASLAVLCPLASAKNGSADKTGTQNHSHLLKDYQAGRPAAAVPDNLEYDVLLSGGSRRNAFIIGRGTADTLAYCPSSGGQFIYDPGEYELIVYRMPADGIIKGVNPIVFEWGDGNNQMQEISIWTVTYPYDSQGEPYPADNADGDGWLGYWTDGINDTVPLFVTDENATEYYGDSPDEIGPCSGTQAVPNAQDLVLERVWPSSDFIHATFTPETAPAQKDNWIVTTDYGSEPEFKSGEWVGLLVENRGPEEGDPTGFYYCEGEGLVDPWVFAKFYNKCNGTSGEGGWHIRHWVLDWPLAVELTGDRGPVFVDWCPLLPTISVEDRQICAHVTDDNPSGGPAGVASVSFWYSVDGGPTWKEIVLTLTEGDPQDGTWTGTLPGQQPGTFVQWYGEATDVEGNVTTTIGDSYSILVPTEPVLFLYNSNRFGSWISEYYLYGLPYGLKLKHDFWSGEWGAAPLELLDHYDTVIEITSGGPEVCNEDLDVWLDEGNKDYIIVGDEWLGECFYGWPGNCGYFPVSIPEGDFVRDYLGIATYYPDINFCAQGDQTGISRLIPVEGDPISGDLYRFLGDSLALNYDPQYETGVSNWLDAVEPTSSADVSFYGVSGVLDSLGIPTGNDTLPVAVYTKLHNGSATAFFGFDVLSVNTSIAGEPVDYPDGYHWIGISSFGPLASALWWMGGVPANEHVTALPDQFVLHQNTPNPFNPVTTISFDLPRAGEVTLVVYDILGREVATLMSSWKAAGRHRVAWDASGVASGIYVYRLTGGDVELTKKMVVLR